MGKSVVLAGFACAAIAVCVWFLWFVDPAPLEAAAPKRDGGRSAELVEGAELAGQTAVAETQSAEAGGIVAATETEPDSRVEASRAPEPVEEEGLEVHVVGPDGEPVEGAEVFMLATSDEDTITRFRDASEVDELMDSVARSEITDASGVVEVPLPGEGKTLVLGRRGDLWGSRYLGAKHGDEEKLELKLAQDVTLRVRVEDKAGAPVTDVPVHIRMKSTWGAWPAQRSVSEGDEAIAVFRHAQSVLSRESDFAWTLALGVLFEEAVEHEFDRLNPPQEIVTLVLPPAASVEVTVYGEDRKPFAREGKVKLGIVREGESRRPSPFNRSWRHMVERPLEHGVARFPFVEPGQEIEIAAFRGGSNVATRTFGAGPTSVGQARAFDVYLGSDHPVALLRALDGAGRPMADAELNVVVFLSGRYSRQSNPDQVRTGADGSFHIDLEGDWAEGAQREILVTRGSVEEPDASGRANASRKLIDGVNDLGIVRLEPAPVFVGGRVVSSAGEPIANATLQLQMQAGEPAHWRRNWRFRYRSDDDGRFKVRGVQVGDRFRLGASKEGLVGRMQEFTPGAEDVVIEMQAEGALEGVVLLDPGFPRELVEVEIESEPESLDHSGEDAEVGEDGAFRFARLLRGEYEVTVRFDGHRSVIESVPGIPILGGETIRDPRLDPLDLRGRYHAHHVTVTLPETEGAFQGNARFGEPGAEKLTERRWFHKPAFWIVSEHEFIDLVVSISGHRPARLESVGGEIEVSPTPGLEVRMVLAPGVHLPQPPLFIKALLAPKADYSALHWGAPAFDDAREITIEVPGPGEMRVVWIVERRTLGSSTARHVRVDEPQIVQVDDVADQRITVSLTEEELARVLESL